MDKLLIICGPTAMGKTKLALELAKKFNGEIISADSRQVYRDINTLTGKDLPKDASSVISKDQWKYKNKKYNLPIYAIDGINLWMYDVVDLHEEFSVGHYQALARQVIDKIKLRGKLPVIVGGTGLYLRSLTQNLSTIHIPPAPTLRRKLSDKTLEELQENLQELDFKKWQAMNQSDRGNPRRLVRAIEISLWQKKHKDEPQVQLENVLWIGLVASMDVIKKRIKERVEYRWHHGALEEVKTLIIKSLPPILGLKPVKDFFDGKTNAESSKAEWRKSEIDYAKRQLTWFNKNKAIHWFNITDSNCKSKIVTTAEKWYTNSK